MGRTVRTYQNPGTRPGMLFDFQQAEHFVGQNWINGKPLFRRVIVFGNLPNANTSVNATGITDVEQMVEISGFATDNTGLFITMPRIAVGNTPQSCDVRFDKGDLIVETFTDLSAFFAFIILVYTKG